MSKHREAEGPDLIDVGVGLRIRTLRRTRGLSQSHLGAALGITFQQVQKYERGTNRISASMLVKAARVLGVGAGALLPEEDDPMPHSSKVLSLLAELRGADELVETYSRIASPHLRRALSHLVAELARASTEDEAGT